jgi:hypothetical protein
MVLLPFLTSARNIGKKGHRQFADINHFCSIQQFESSTPERIVTHFLPPFSETSTSTKSKKTTRHTTVSPCPNIGGPACRHWHLALSAAESSTSAIPSVISRGDLRAAPSLRSVGGDNSDVATMATCRRWRVDDNDARSPPSRDEARGVVARVLMSTQNCGRWAWTFRSTVSLFVRFNLD